MSLSRVLLPIAACVALASCLVDFDPFDPRLGGSGGAVGQGGNASGGAASSSSSQGQGGSTSSSSSGVGGGGGTSAGGSTGAGGAMDIEYIATIADCVNTTVLDPDACLADQSGPVFSVDGQDGPLMEILHGYVRFDLDAQLSGKTVTGAIVRLTVSTVAGANSSNTGELWQVASFTRPDLFVMTPMAIGLLGMDQGPVAVGQVVDFTIPANLVTANGSVFLGVIPIATNSDGVDYWNLMGTAPPKLIVTVQ